MENHIKPPLHMKVPRALVEFLELVKTDLMEPVNVPSNGDSQYFITFIDDLYKLTTVYMIHEK